MSFITKRERVFNEYDLFDLPSRNEGKLKAYASCTDARAWSHFCSDKSEHLFEIIKRNNDTCRPKYVPTNVIVETLMVAKNTEINRLKRKIEEFEQLLATYDELDLTCEQKCEIATAHAAIKAANKELDELYLDLNLSGYTEGIDSEVFETGKSRGDEPSRYKVDETAKSKGEEWTYERDRVPITETKSNQTDTSCTCDANTSATDPRIEEMQGDLVVKDAKLNAMQNTIAVMENDVCEPYCLYAHIYTALEKIFGILCQNEKYKQYIDLLTAGKDIQCIDIKGKILFKLIVFEKFCLALVAPCCKDFNENSNRECSCYYAEIVTRIEATYALTSSESKEPNLDNKRAQLVADITHNEEMKEILSKDNTPHKDEIQTQDDDFVSIGNYSIDGENLKRLKGLQENFDELMTCYESLKHERDCLKIKCHKYENLELELENLRCQLREYNTLWTDKEYYKKRSTNLDGLKEQYLLLSNEVSNLETQLQAEAQINNIKSQAIDELRNENILLVKKLNDASIAFEKEKNTLLCKLNETECKVMCEEQQIKSLSLQIERLLEESHAKESNTNEMNEIILLNQIESQKEQITNLKEALLCNEEEKQNLQENFQDKLKFINELKMEIEEWRSTYGKTVQRNEYLEQYIDDIRDESKRLTTINQTLSQQVKEKAFAVENLVNVVNNKSQEVDRLMEEVHKLTTDHKNIFKKYQELQEKYKINVGTLENEKIETITSLKIAKQESQELLQRMKNHDDMVYKQDDTLKELKSRSEKIKELQQLLLNITQENKDLKANLMNVENKYSILLEEVHELREINNHAITDMENLQNERDQYKITHELTKKENKEIESKFHEFENLRQELDYLRESRDKLIENKHILENKLHDKTSKLDLAINCVELSKKESSELLYKIEQYKRTNEGLAEVEAKNEILSKENLIVKQDLVYEKKKVELLNNEIKNLKEETEHIQIRQSKSTFEKELIDLKTAYDAMLTNQIILKQDLDKKIEEIKGKTEENRELIIYIQSLKQQIETATNNIKELETENLTTKNALSVIRKENVFFIDKIKEYEILKSKFDNLTKVHVQLKGDKELLEKEIKIKTENTKKLEKENHELHNHSQTLLSHSKDLENALMNARSGITFESNSIIQSQYAIVLNEIEEMKKEKLKNQSKIRDLLNKLDEMETIISDLSEQVLARDDKIVILENHINELEDEVRQLHNCLDEVVDAGEQLKSNSYEKIDQSLKKMEAHHSKAAHNMKIELTQLYQENNKLENQLSFTKLKSEEILKDKHKYVSQIIHLQNEREIIVTDIKQLELSYVGDSGLSPGKCNIEDILNSLQRIQKYLDTTKSRSTSLEQTLVQVQSSSQLLLSKAEEAKRIVEKEKQKIINEKEEVIRERVNIEKQLVDLKETLTKQIYCDQDIIRDLESEILNKDLIIDKINKSSQNYISKLQDEIQNMKDLYERSLKEVEDIQERMKVMSATNAKNVDIINKINTELQVKSKEVDVSQQHFEKLKNISTRNLGIQTMVTELFRNIEIQTENELQYDELDRSDLVGKDYTKNQNKILAEKSNHCMVHKAKLNFTNEVQVLNAKVENTFDYARNIYLNYKMKQLSYCQIEHYSISCHVDDIHENHMKILSSLSTPVFNHPPGFHQPEKDYIGTVAENSNLINIYDRTSTYIDPSRTTNNDDQDTVFTSKPTLGTPTKFSAFTDLGLTTESFDSKLNNVLNNQDKISNLFNYSTSENSTDKDVFVIYQDNDSSDTPETQDYTGLQISKWHSEILAETCTVYQNEYTYNYKKDELAQNEETSKEKSNYKDSHLYLEDKEHHNEKPNNKFNINLPIVEQNKNSVVASHEEKSPGSNKLAIYPSSKQISTSSINVNLDNNKKLINKSSLPNILSNGVKYLDSVNLDNREIDINILRHVNIKKRKPMNSDNIENDKESSTETKKRKGFGTYKENNVPHDSLLRVNAKTMLTKNRKGSKAVKDRKIHPSKESYENFGIKYIVDSIKCDIQPGHVEIYDTNNKVRGTRSDESLIEKLPSHCNNTSSSELRIYKLSSPDNKSETSLSKSMSKSEIRNSQKTFQEQSVMVKTDIDNDYETKILNLTQMLEHTEKDYKKKIETIKMQYDKNVKCIINDHNEGVKTIQSIHEETFQDILKVHENEIENLRSMSIEAMRKADKLEKENRTLKMKISDRNSHCLDEESFSNSALEAKRCNKCHETKTLTKTNIEAFNVKPKVRSHGLCTCSLEVNISETIRNIFEQVDAEQRKMAEHTYLKYIANKIINDNVEALDTKELSFLHFKVCRTWKTKMNKKETLQKRIDLLENELLHKQLYAQQHMADLDREVTEERRRLQELREAVCRKTPPRSRTTSPGLDSYCIPPPPPTLNTNKKLSSKNHYKMNNASISERRSAGDLVVDFSNAGIRPRRLRMETNRAVLAKLDTEERRQKKFYSDEPPTRLRRSQERQTIRSQKKL